MKRYMLGLALAIGFAGAANAATFKFECIAGASVACGVGEASLSVELTDNGNGTVNLVLSNSDPGTSVATGIYIDDSRLMKRPTLAGGAGTLFRKNGKPSDLPGGSVVAFQDDFRFTARKPVDPNGVDGGESLTLVLRLKNGVTYADVISALASGALRIGVHIADADPSCVGTGTGPQCTGDPGSASFVNLPNPVPEPMAQLLGGLACVGLAIYGRRR
jgi:hypothetical protein